MLGSSASTRRDPTRRVELSFGAGVSLDVGHWKASGVGLDANPIYYTSLVLILARDISATWLAAWIVLKALDTFGLKFQL